MTLSQQEYDSIIHDTSKIIRNDITWEITGNPRSRNFTTEIDSDSGYPIFVKGWYNASSGKLSYSIVHRSAGRIYGLDLGAEHVNPDGKPVGEKHKNYWKPGMRDKWAYAPEDITEPWNRPVEVWGEFCAEANLKHSGTMRNPPDVGIQGLMPL